ncbi:MAG: hypothetical protein HZA46_20350 [Planctomycetales bacterium]|nr:hypothetical protein [Planctomycetales bacterium]
MGYTLLWIENLTFWLLLIALAVALAIRVKRPWRRRTLLVATAVLAPGACLLATLAIWALETTWSVPTGLFTPVLALSVCCTVGLLVILRNGLRRDDQQAPRASQWRLGTLALATTATLVLHLMTFWNLDLSVRQQMETLRAEAGTLAMSVAPARIPDRDNAAVLYVQAFEGGLLDPLPKEYNEWFRLMSDEPDKFNPLDPALTAYLVHLRPLLVLVREATARSGCNFNRDWGRPSISMLIPETQDMRAAARALQLEAHALAAQGDVRGACDNILAMHRLAEHVSEEPFLISQLVSFAIDSMAVRTLELLLQRHPVTVADLARFEDFRSSPVRPGLQRAFRAEEAMMLSTFCAAVDWRELEPLTKSGIRPRGDESNPMYWPLNASAVYRVFFWATDVQSYREHLHTIQMLPTLPYKQAHEVWSKTEESTRNSPIGIMTRLLLPAFSQMHVAGAHADAKTRLAQLAVAMHRHRLQHGAFPSDLDELPRDGNVLIPRDPFDGQPLRLTKTDDSVIMYSVGQDLKDDHGAKMDDQTRTGDLTFVLKIPAGSTKPLP